MSNGSTTPTQAKTPTSIYPSIPDPGNTIATMVPCLLAIKQTLQLIILNAQSPHSTYTPSSAAQIFVTKGQLDAVQNQLTALQKKVG